MARGEGAEQCASTLLAAKPLHADIKTPKVKDSRLLKQVMAPELEV